MVFSDFEISAVFTRTISHIVFLIAFVRVCVRVIVFTAYVSLMRFAYLTRKRVCNTQRNRIHVF